MIAINGTPCTLSALFPSAILTVNRYFNTIGTYPRCLVSYTVNYMGWSLVIVSNRQWLVSIDHLLIGLAWTIGRYNSVTPIVSLAIISRTRRHGEFISFLHRTTRTFLNVQPLFVHQVFVQNIRSFYKLCCFSFLKKAPLLICQNSAAS